VPGARPRGPRREPARRRDVRLGDAALAPDRRRRGPPDRASSLGRARACRGARRREHRRAPRAHRPPARGLEGGMSEQPALLTDGLGKRYGSAWALRDCDLALPAGTVTALVGPNGAGKTTLLQLAVGLSRPSAGDLRVLGLSPRHEAGALLPRL